MSVTLLQIDSSSLFLDGIEPKFQIASSSLFFDGIAPFFGS